jgi:hypothetical protein
VNLKILVILAPTVAAVLMTLLGIAPRMPSWHCCLSSQRAELSRAARHRSVIVGFFSKRSRPGMSY